MKQLILMSMAALAWTTQAADKMYAEEPDDTSVLRQEDGTATMVGASAFSHLKYQWSFDEAATLREATIGSATFSMLRNTGKNVESVTNDVKRGAGAVYFPGNLGLYLSGADVPSFITPKGEKPFTISLWLKGGERGTKASRILFFGPSGQQDAGKFIDFMYQNDATMEKFYYGQSATGFQITPTPVGRWIHAALVVEPCGTWQEDGSVKNVSVTLYADGVKHGPTQYVLNAGESPILCLGTGYGKTSKNAAPLADTIIDEVQIYDAALTADEVHYVAEQTKPLEFSAGWEVMQGGRLELGTVKTQSVWGVGTVADTQPLHLAETVGSVFSGTIEGTGLVIENEAGVSTTLAGANAYTGETHVVSGMLRVDTGLSADVPDFAGELLAYYPMDDVRHPGLDYSGKGNSVERIKTDGDRSRVTYDSAKTVAGGALDFPLDGTQTSSDGYKCGYSTVGLNGFTDGADNSFAVGGWVRVNEHHYREGFFGWGNYGIRLNNAAAHNFVYFGDTGNQGSYTLPVGRFDDHVWRHVALVYDSQPVDANYAFRFFIDGVEVAHHARNSGKNFKHGCEQFYVGRSLSAPGPDNTNYFDGQLDEIFVVKGADTNDVAKMYNHRRAAFAAANAKNILPATTTLTVDDGATADFVRAAETVAGLAGAGTVCLAADSSLSVSSSCGFTGTVTGEGVLTLGENLVWETDDAEPGVYTYFAVPEGFQLPDTSNWTFSPAKRRTASWAVRDGRIVMTLEKNGLILLFK